MELIDLCADLDEKKPGERLGDWLSLYHTADVLLMSRLQNDMVDMDLRCVDEDDFRVMSWTVYSAADWYNNGVVQTPYYQLFLADAVQNINYYSLNWTENALKDLLEYPQSLLDLLVKSNQWRSKPWSAANINDRCKYHIHENGESCNNEKEKS